MPGTNGTTYKNGHTQAIDTLPPHDREAEEGVLGSLIIDPDAIVQVDPFLRPEHFYLAANGLIYEAIRDLYRRNEPADLITIMAELRRHGHAEVGNGQDEAEVYLLGLIRTVPTSINAVTYGRIVEQLATRRGMIRAASKIAKLAYDQTDDLEEQLTAAEAELMTVRGDRPTSGVNRPRDYVRKWLTRLERIMDEDAPMLGLPSPWLDLNRMLQGFLPFVYYIGGRPGMGKSSLLLDLAAYWALDLGKRVYFWTGEMTTDQLTDRIVSSRARIDLTRLRSGKLTPDEHSRAVNAAGLISDSGLIIDDTAAITPSALRAKCYQEAMRGGLDAIIGDYIGLMRPDRNLKNRNDELTEISGSLVALARGLGVPAVVATQLSRAVENRADKHPQLSDLRDSGSLEQDGYAVMFLYRDDYYNELSQRPNVADLDIAKHRDGPTGQVNLYWDRQRTSFKNLSREVVL